MADTILIHTDEISLKGGNRRFFEELLLKNVRLRLNGLGDFNVSKRKGVVSLRRDELISDDEEKQVVDGLSKVFGIAHFWLAQSCQKDMAKIKDLSVEAMKDRQGSFRVTAKRGDKRFTKNSMELSREIGGAVLASNDGLKVDLHTPDHTLYIEVNHDGAYVSVGRYPGAGGLPTDTTGKMAVMLSGGIDSPVAAWRVMSRGTRVEFVHFHSYPHVGKESIEKVKRLAGILDGYQLGSRLHLIPFADIQREITAKTSGPMRVVLYRRFMLRMCEAVARQEGALGLVTGDSIGQVASQTLENMATVSAAVTMSVYRPLVGDGKNSIVAQARAIGTYETSIEPHDDCCSLFVPDHPELRSTTEQAEEEEKNLDVERLIEDALSKIELITL
jgi:thiamine biosynthesis protein ThiI